MPSFENTSREEGLPRDPHDDLKTARDLYLVGGPESDRQAVTILRRVFEQSRDASGRVPLDKVDSLPQIDSPSHSSLCRGRRPGDGHQCS